MLISELCTKRFNFIWSISLLIHITSVSLQFCKALNAQLQVTEADIEEFEANYRGSDSEKKDLIDLYKKHKGNMNRYNSNDLASS